MIFPIRTFGDPVLRTPAMEVTDFDAALQTLVDDLLETMYDAPGVGLAAPQIGVPRQVFVFDIGEGPAAMVNPELVEVSGEWEFEEGCLSVPNRFWPLTRPAFARVRGRDPAGEEVEYAGEDLLGRVLQHEYDHLGGTLLIARLTKAQRTRALRELREEALGLRQP